jgi:hypothetical protein
VLGEDGGHLAGQAQRSPCTLRLWLGQNARAALERVPDGQLAALQVQVLPAVAGPAARAGVKAGVEYAYASSVVRRRIERDEKGQITGTIEERVPSP